MYDILNHTISPFSRPLKFDGPLVIGFITKPHHSTENPEGWGEPLIDAKGEKIIPGTVGGEKANWFLGADVKDSEPDEYGVVVTEPDQKFINRDDLQVAGNIDWKGPQTETHIEGKHKHIRISYNGPRSRYWAEPSFAYTNEDKFKEIYIDGKYLTIAPGPVLGACLSEGTVNRFDSITGEYANAETLYVLAIVKSGKEDILYRKILTGSTTFSESIPGVIKSKRLPQEVDPEDDVAVAAKEAKEEADKLRFDAWVTLQKELYHPIDKPDGWKFIASFPEQEEAYTADSPWFFNESGTEAQCMRKVDVTFDDGSGTDVTEMDHSRYKCSIIPNSAVIGGILAVFSNEGNEIDFYRYTTTESSEKTHQERVSLNVNSVDPNGNTGLYWPSYGTLGDGDDGWTHDWQIDSIEQIIQMYGLRVVAVDYEGDALLLAKMKYSMMWGFWQYWSFGVDEDGVTPDYNEAGFVDNAGDIAGPRYVDEDIETYQQQNDYRSTRWAGFDDDVDLVVYKQSSYYYSFKLYSCLNTASPDALLQDIPQEVGTLAYVGQYTNVIRFADLRKKMFVYKQELRNQYMQPELSVGTVKVDYEFNENHVSKEDYTATQYTENINKTTTENALDTGITEHVMGYPRADMVAWTDIYTASGYIDGDPFNEEYERINITGEMTTANEDDAIYPPYMGGYLAPVYWPFFTEWPLLTDLLYEQEDEGGFGMDDADNLLYSITTDGADGEEFDLIVSTDGNVESKFKASIDRLYPLWII